MSQEPKNNYSNWRPSASIENLKKRAEILRNIRAFFYARHVIEVETPLLCHSTVTDVYLDSLQSMTNGEHCFLQTSPEYAIKRLLAAGIGDCYQICKAFRDNESGHHHNPEFTMLEWYRIGFNHHQLMDDMDALLQTILQCAPAQRMSYQKLFEIHLTFNPHEISIHALKTWVKQHHQNLFDALGDDCDNKDDWLMLLLSHLIEPTLGFDAPCFIYDYPASQAALAKIRHEKFPIGERFEVYIRGMELANGFHELQDNHEQQLRFEKDLAARKLQSKPLPPIDKRFLSALEYGLPECSGVALGVDRLIMIALNANNIQDVLSFDFSKA